jgi:hypothetical protein
MEASFWWLPLRRTGVTNREVWAKLAVKWDLVTPPAPRLLLHDTRPDSAKAASASLGDDHLLLGCFVTASTVWHCIIGRDKFYIIPSSVPALLFQFLSIYFSHSTLYSFPLLRLHVSLESKKQVGLWNHIACRWYMGWCACVFLCMYLSIISTFERGDWFSRTFVCIYATGAKPNPYRLI